MDYSQLIKQVLDEKGHGNLGLTGQNLRDQASRLQKTGKYSANSYTHMKGIGEEDVTLHTHNDSQSP